MPYLNTILSDCSGSINAMVWDYSGPVTEKDAGKVIKVRGSVSEYKGSLQVTVDRIRLAVDSDTYNISHLVPTAPIDIESEMADVRNLIAGIEDTDYRRICAAMLQRYFGHRRTGCRGNLPRTRRSRGEVRPFAASHPLPSRRPGAWRRSRTQMRRGRAAVLYRSH